MVSFFHVSTPLKNAFIEVAVEVSNKYISLKRKKESQKHMKILVTYKENDEQDSNHPFCHDHIEENSNANSKNEHWLEKKS